MNEILVLHLTSYVLVPKRLKPEDVKSIHDGHLQVVVEDVVVRSLQPRECHLRHNTIALMRIRRHADNGSTSLDSAFSLSLFVCVFLCLYVFHCEVGSGDGYGDMKV